MPISERDEREVIEIMRTIAKQTRAFYDALVEQRFRCAEALALTHTWLDASTRRPPEIKG